MAGYILEFKEEDYDEVIEKMHKAKKAVCEAFEALEQAGDENEMQERGTTYHRRGMSRREGWEDERMNERRGRGGRYSY